MNDSGKKYIIGVEIGGGHISAGLVDTHGVLVRDSVKYYKLDSGASKNDILDKWALAINRVLSKTDQSNVIGISFAMPGAFDYKNGVALFDGNSKYYALYKTNIHDELSSRLLVGDLPMRFINDATAYAIGEAWKGQAQDCYRSIGFTLGTGIGSAFIEDGLPVVNRADVPPQGCLWHLPFKDGIVDQYFSTRWFKTESESKYGVRINGVKSLAAAGRKHKHVEEIFARFGQNLGELVSPWIKKFQPQCLCFGGNISLSADIFGSYFQDELAKHQINIRVVYSNQTEELALLGSTRLFDSELWLRVEPELPTI